MLSNISQVKSSNKIRINKPLTTNGTINITDQENKNKTKKIKSDQMDLIMRMSSSAVYVPLRQTRLKPSPRLKCKSELFQLKETCTD